MLEVGDRLSVGPVDLEVVEIGPVRTPVSQTPQPPGSQDFAEDHRDIRRHYKSRLRTLITSLRHRERRLGQLDEQLEIVTKQNTQLQEQLQSSATQLSGVPSIM